MTSQPMSATPLRSRPGPTVFRGTVEDHAAMTAAFAGKDAARCNGPNKNGAVASAVPGAPHVEPPHFDWRWRERPARARLAWETSSRSADETTPHSDGVNKMNCERSLSRPHRRKVHAKSADLGPRGDVARRDGSVSVVQRGDLPVAERQPAVRDHLGRIATR
jgi:hypothetical protein